MNKIVKMNGYVYLVENNSSDGRFQTFYNLGKDIDSPIWKEEVEKMKNSKTQKKKTKTEN